MEINNKNILITGGTGFIGSHLVEELINKGIRPYVIIRSMNPQNYFLSKNINKKVVNIYSDVNNFLDIKRIIYKYQIQIIFHLAAQTLVETAYQNPYETLQTNIMGSVNILEATRDCQNIKAIIIASSDKAYGKKGISKYKETDALKGDHPYEVSKSAADLISQMYFKTYKLPVTIARFGNIYGEGDLNFSRILPGIMKAIINKNIFEIRSNGKFIRDYIYVKDVVNGYLSLIKYWPKTYGQVFNFGSNTTLSVIDMIKIIEKTLKLQIKYKILNLAKNEIPYQSLNFNKAKDILHWKNRFLIDQTIPQIFNWYKNYFSKI